MKRFELSLLDRLIDDDARSSSVNPNKQISVEEIKDCVARDIEHLLNSRIALSDESLKNLPNCKRSILTCGVRDFVGMSLASFQDQTIVCKEIERAISSHERRLRNVHVSLRPQPGDTQSLVFTIEALLMIYPLREPISFDALMLPNTQKYSVQKFRRI